MKVAFVVQRCGVEIDGGAEALCLQVASHMAKHWETEVLTTCALDYMRWDNHYAPGIEPVGSTLIRRFKVDKPRDVPKFDALSIALREKGTAARLEEQEDWMRAQGPLSADLFDFIAANRDQYDAFIFFGYLYATTYFGLPLVAEKACLAPLGHDEWPIYFTMWDSFFKRPKRFIFQTPEEQKFLRSRFSHLPLEGGIAGIGIESPPRLDPGKFRQKYNLTDPFLLYVGRIDAAKGCDEMFELFERLRGAESQARKLVLIGREVLPIPFHDDIVHLGFVDEMTKWNAMAGCDWLLMPSIYESLSIVLLESWMTGRPALVNAGSEVLVGHCRRSNGGLWYSNYAEWRQAIRECDQMTKDTLGHQGKRYVEANYSWDRIENEYKTAVAERGLDKTMA